jgi:hypothetical protein
MHAVRTGPDAAPSAAAIVGHRVDGASRKVGTADLLDPPRGIGAQNEAPFHRADEQENVATAGRDVRRLRHNVSTISQPGRGGAIRKFRIQNSELRTPELQN